MDNAPVSARKDRPVRGGTAGAEPPLVSICIPSYNHAAYLPRTIESVLGQTYPNVEAVIVDDGSTDGSLAVAEEYARRFPDRVRVFTHPGGENRGISATVNRAFALSRGRYWGGMGSDDVLLPGRIRRQVDFLEANPSIGMVYGHVRTIDAAGEPLGRRLGEDVTRARHPIDEIIQVNPIYAMSVLVRREVKERAGEHEDSLINSDWEFWIRIAAISEIACLDECFAYYRLHGANTSSTTLPPSVHMERAAAVMEAVDRRAESIGGRLLEPRRRALVQLQLAYWRFSLGREEQAEADLWRAFATDRSLPRDPHYLTEWLLRCQQLGRTDQNPGYPEFTLWALARMAPVLPMAVTARLAREIADQQDAFAAFRERAPGSVLRLPGILLRAAVAARRSPNARARFRTLAVYTAHGVAGRRLVRWLWRAMRRSAA